MENAKRKWWLEQLQKLESKQGRRITVTYFAKYLEISQATISSWINETRTPSESMALKVAQKLDSARTIKDLIVIVEKYRSRCMSIFDGMLNRKRKIQSFPFQIMLLGYADLNRTVKRIVNLSI